MIIADLIITPLPFVDSDFTAINLFLPVRCCVGSYSCCGWIAECSSLSFDSLFNILHYINTGIVNNSQSVRNVFKERLWAFDLSLTSTTGAFKKRDVGLDLRNCIPTQHALQICDIPHLISGVRWINFQIINFNTWNSTVMVSFQGPVHLLLHLPRPMPLFHNARG